MIITYQFWGTCFTLQFQLKGHVICRNTKSHRKLNFLMRLLTLTQSISHVSLRKVQLVWQDKQNSQHMEILLLFTFIYVYLSYHISIYKLNKNRSEKFSFSERATNICVIFQYGKCQSHKEDRTNLCGLLRKAEL